MNPIIKNDKTSKMKLMAIPKINKNNIIYNNKSKSDLRTNCNYINQEKEKNLLINDKQDTNITPFEMKSNLEKKNLKYEKSNNDLYNILANEKSTKTDDSSGEEKVTRKIQVQTPLNLTEKFNKTKINKLNKYSLSLSLMNYISNKPNNICKLQEILENKDDFKNDEMKKAIYYKDHNTNKEQNQNIFINETTFNGNNYDEAVNEIRKMGYAPERYDILNVDSTGANL